MKLKNILFIIISPLVISFFITGCKNSGTYIEVEAPVTTVNTPTYSSIDPTNQFFEFWTNEIPFQDEDSYPSDFIFLGTEVYYKIYSSCSTLVSEISNLNSLASSSETSSSATTKLIEIYNYKKLKSSNYSSSPLIKASDDSTNQKVLIQLTDYNNDSPAKIFVNQSYMNVSGLETSPLRSSSANFNFGGDGNVPNEYDSDVNYSSSLKDNTWYVAMFALAVGRDATYTTYYSNILYLGSVSIKESNYTHKVHNHDFSDWLIVQDSTCSTEGKKVHTCSECNYVETCSIPLKEHTVIEWSVVRESTCITTGSKKGTCSLCGTVILKDIPLAEHTYDDGVITTAPTCTEKGIKTYTCSVCSETITEEIEATGHTYNDGVITTAPTCTEKGVKTFTCTVCSATKTEEIDATGHSYGDWVTVTEATCSTDGQKKHTCSVCSNEETEIITSTGHDGTYYCSSCKQYLVDICEIGKEYTDSFGLSVIMNSITKTEETGYIAYKINYTVKNITPDTSTAPGTFDIIYSDDTSVMQTGFFNLLYYDEQETRSYTWKVLKTKTPVVFKYSNAFESSSSQTPLYWAVP